MRDETLQEKKLRIFETYYERIIKERYYPDRPIRYSVIEYLCSFPKINPVYMARRLANSGYEIAFDDTSISQSANNRKRMEVFNYEYRKRNGLGTAIPMFLEEPSSEQEKNNIEDAKDIKKDERTYKPYYDYLKQYISDNLDNGLITLYHDYDDNIDKDVIQKYINAVVLGYPTDSFYDVIYEYAASCIDADYYEDALINELLHNAPTEEIREQIKNADYADIIDDLNECGYIGVDYNIGDLLRNTSVKVNVLLGTDTERNYDMDSIVTAYGNDYQYPFKDYAKPDVDDYDNALTYLIHQQGHTVQDVLANHLDCCLSDEQISKSGFIKGVCTDIEENSSESMSELGVYIELSGDEIPEFCEKLSDKNAYLVFDKDVNIGLFNEWSGSCGYPDNYLEKDFVVPTTMVRNVQIEGVRPITRERAEKLRNIYKNTDSEYAKQRAGQNLETEGVIGYTIDGVCGMVGDFWKSNAVSYTDTAPILVNEDIETTLNEIEQANKEKNEEIER